MYKVNYETARSERKFSYFISNGVDALAKMAELSHHDIFTDYKAGIKLYSDENVNKVNAMFNNKLRPVQPSTGHIAYGHVSCLGMELVFPKDGEVNYVREKKSLDEWMAILKKDIELSDLAKKQIVYKEKLQEAFPNKKIAWTFSYEGPLTTAYELRDMDVFYDIYDQPEKLKEFLHVLTDSISSYAKIYKKMNGPGEMFDNGWGVCDDVAAMFSHELWDEYVIPHWDQFFSSMTSGTRYLHCEDMDYKHVKYLEKANIFTYDPAVSPKLNPQLIRDNTRVPFKWKLNGFYYNNMNSQDVTDWVYKAVEDGASELFSNVTYQMLDNEGVKKVLAFDEACKISKEMLDKGISREEIGKMVSKEGKEKFWANWHG